MGIGRIAACLWLIRLTCVGLRLELVSRLFYKVYEVLWAQVVHKDLLKHYLFFKNIVYVISSHYLYIGCITCISERVGALCL